MTRAECRRCGRHSYKNGKCYADWSRKGKPIEMYIACDWAGEKKSKTTPKK